MISPPNSLSGFSTVDGRESGVSSPRLPDGPDSTAAPTDAWSLHADFGPAILNYRTSCPMIIFHCVFSLILFPFLDRDSVSLLPPVRIKPRLIKYLKYLLIVQQDYLCHEIYIITKEGFSLSVCLKWTHMAAHFFTFLTLYFLSISTLGWATFIFI